jgi:hypothetical protein
MGHVLDSTLKICSFLQSLPIRLRISSKFKVHIHLFPIPYFHKHKFRPDSAPSHLAWLHLVFHLRLPISTMGRAHATHCSVELLSTWLIATICWRHKVSLVLAVKVNAHVTTCLPRREKILRAFLYSWWLDHRAKGDLRVFLLRSPLTLFNGISGELHHQSSPSLRPFSSSPVFFPFYKNTLCWLSL